MCYKNLTLNVNRSFAMKRVKLILALFSIFISVLTNAQQAEDYVLIFIGGSFQQGKTPYNLYLNGPLYGAAVNGGRYVSLASEFDRMGYYIINEAQAGATTFERIGCGYDFCVEAYWDSYETQLDRAIPRVTSRDGTINAKFVVIGTSNDCLHPGAFNVPFIESKKCDYIDLIAWGNRLVAVAKRVQSYGLVPIVTEFPRWTTEQLKTFQEYNNMPWISTVEELDIRRKYLKTILHAELDEFIYVRPWGNFQSIIDGIHPTEETVTNAALTIENAMNEYLKNESVW